MFISRSGFFGTGVPLSYKICANSIIVYRLGSVRDGSHSLHCLVRSVYLVYDKALVRRDVS